MVYSYLKEQKFFGPVAVLLGHLSVLVIQNVSFILPQVDGAVYSKGIMTLLLFCAYLYSWSQGNPHMAEPLKNSFIYELSLTMTAGYHASILFSSKFCHEMIYSLLIIMAISGSFTVDQGANVFATYSLMSEIPTLFCLLSECATQYRHPCKQLVEVLFLVVLVGAKTLGLWHFTYMMLRRTEIPVIPQLEALALTICSFYTVRQKYCAMVKSNNSTLIGLVPTTPRAASRVVTKRSPRRRSGSSSRSRNNSRSRSRSSVSTRSGRSLSSGSSGRVIRCGSRPIRRC